jgi:hypothetical protein
MACVKYIIFSFLKMVQGCSGPYDFDHWVPSLHSVSNFFFIKYYYNIILGRLILCLELFWPVDSGLAFFLCPNLPSFLIFFLFTFNIFTPGYPSPFSIMNIMGSLVLLINKNKL